MPSERPSFQPHPPDEANDSLTERALRRQRKYQIEHRHPNEPLHYPKDSSPEARVLFDHLDAIRHSSALMPEQAISDALMFLGGWIEQRGTTTPRWALAPEHVKSVVEILGMTERQIGLRPFGGDAVSEQHPNSHYTHYIDAPLPVLLLLRARIDQIYREAVSGETGKPERIEAKQRKKKRGKRESLDRQATNKKLQSIIDKIIKFY